MSNISVRITKFYKNHSLLMCIFSGLLCLSAFILEKLDLTVFAGVLYLASLLFTFVPVINNAISSLRFKIVSIELLVTIAVIGAIAIGEFSEAGIVTFLFQIGSYLELKTLENTRKSIKSLLSNAPKTAIRIVGDIEEEIDIDDVEEGDFLFLRTGRMSPVDGVIESGECYCIEASITGESMPVHKKHGDRVYGSSVIDSGEAVMRATTVGEDTTYSKIISLVEEAQDSKSKIDRFIDHFAKYYTPAVIVLAVLTFLLKLAVTGIADIDTSITVLVLACPGALVIGAPVANVAGIGAAARDHILLKGGDSLHTFAKTDYFVFDKTGTLTEGNTEVINSCLFYLDIDDNVIINDLGILKKIEEKSDHPLARAIVRDLSDSDTHSPVETKTVKGKGIIGYSDNHRYIIGNEALMDDYKVIYTEPAELFLKSIKTSGHSFAIAAKDQSVIAIFEIGDKIREDASELISLIGQNRCSILSGDSAPAVMQLSRSLGLSKDYYELLPEDKLNIIKEMKQNGRVCFIGDGINDGPALALADTGIAIGSGTEAAIEISDIVLISDRLTDLYKAYRICRKTVAVTYENIVIAVGTVIALLAGLFLGFIHLSTGMLIHEGSILVVTLNALRILIRRKNK